MISLSLSVAASLFLFMDGTNSSLEKSAQKSRNRMIKSLHENVDCELSSSCIYRTPVICQGPFRVLSRQQGTKQTKVCPRGYSLILG